MILIADSGATKTDWLLAGREAGIVASFRTAGVNVAAMSESVVDAVLDEAFGKLGEVSGGVEEIFFYAAGVVSQQTGDSLARKIADLSGCGKVSCRSDLVASARALFGDSEGVAAIMGTGSNSCLCRGGEVVKNIPSGGYVLGDEGGAVSVGRRFLSDWIKGLVPEQMGEDFRRETGLDYASVVSKVYREGSPSGFMASYAPFVLKYSGTPYADALLDDCLEAFVSRNLTRYGCPRAGVTGSFGCAVKDRLKRVGERYGMVFDKFLTAPAGALADYHLKKNQMDYGI